MPAATGERWLFCHTGSSTHTCGDLNHSYPATGARCFLRGAGHKESNGCIRYHSPKHTATISFHHFAESQRGGTFPGCAEQWSVKRSKRRMMRKLEVPFIPLDGKPTPAAI